MFCPTLCITEAWGGEGVLKVPREDPDKDPGLLPGQFSFIHHFQPYKALGRPGTPPQ